MGNGPEALEQRHLLSKLGRVFLQRYALVTVSHAPFPKGHVAHDLECQEMVKESYMGDALVSREEVIEVGNQDSGLLQLPLRARATDPVDWLKSYTAARAAGSALSRRASHGPLLQVDGRRGHSARYPAVRAWPLTMDFTFSARAAAV